MLRTATRFTGSTLIVGCEGVFGERECPSLKDSLVFLSTGKTVNNRSAG